MRSLPSPPLSALIAELPVMRLSSALPVSALDSPTRLEKDTLMFSTLGGSVHCKVVGRPESPGFFQ